MSTVTFLLQDLYTLFSQRSFPFREQRDFGYLLRVIFCSLALTACIVIAPSALAQNVQNSDKGLDLGMRSTVRVNPVTRGVNFEIPLGTYVGRADIKVPVILSYSSKVWAMKYEGYNPGAPPPHGSLPPFTIVTARYAQKSVSGWTSSVKMPTIDNEPGTHLYDQNGFPRAVGYCPVPCYVVDRKLVWMPDGSSHEIRASDQPRLTTASAPDTYYSVDGSRLRYQVSTDTLYLPDGSRYLITAGEYIDRNGNKLTSSAQGLVDTMGRAINDPLPYSLGTAPSAGDQNFSLLGINGSTINYVLKWRNLGNVLTTADPLRYIGNSGCPPTTGGTFSPSLFGSDMAGNTCIGNASVFFNPVVLHQIVLPNGQAYTFTYNVYGEIDKVVLPTGGYERYQYVQVPPISFMSSVYAQTNRGVSNQFMSPSGSGADESQWQYSGSMGSVTITAPAPASTRTELSIWTDANSNWGYGPDGARAGQIYDQRIYSASNQLLRRKMTDWVMTGSNASGNPSGTQNANRNSRVARETEFWLDTGGNALARTTTFAYDTTYQFSVGIERTSVSEYEFVEVSQSTAQTVPIGSLGTIPTGSLSFTATTAYLTSNQTFRDRHMLSLPSSVSLYNGSGTLMSQTTFAYDEPAYPLISVAGPYTNWTDPATTVRANATTKSQWLNTTGTYLVSHSQYDQFGNVRNVWDARQIQSQVNYSSTYAFAYPTETTSADPDGGGPLTSLTTSTEYDFSTGRITATVAPHGQRSTFSYNDPLNRLKQIIQAETNAATKTQMTYSYDDVTRTVTVTSDKIAYDDNLYKSVKLFDGFSRLIETREYESPTDYIAVKTEHDPLGRAFKVSNPHRNGETPVWTTTEYDDLGRIISVTSPDNAVFRTAYSGNRTLVTDQAGKQRLSSNTASGQIKDLWEITAADGATEAVSFPGHPEVTAGYRTSYEYNVFNSLVKVTQGSQQRFFMYDSLQRLIRVRSPETGTHASLSLADSLTGNSQWSFGYQYDANGNLIQKTDPRGIVSTYAYDNLNRNITIDYSDTALSPDVSRFYDGATNGKGRPWYSYSGGNLTVGSNVEYTSFDSYDNVGRPLQLTQKFKLNGVWGPQYQVSRSYNRAGGVTSQTYPSGHSVAYTQDGAGRTGSFVGNLGDGTFRSYATNLTYSPFGGLSREQFGTNIPLYHKAFYNIRGQLFDLRLSSVNDTWDWNRGRLIYYYSSNHLWAQSGTDNNGNIMFAETWLPPENATLDQADSLVEDRYTYDALNRLTSVAEQRMTAAGGWVWSQQLQQSYNYDRFGNRTMNTAQTWGVGTYNKQFSVDSATNRLGVPAGQSGTMTYDNGGNLTTDTWAGTGQRTYDADNNMTSAQDGLGGWAYYTYNVEGQRTRRKINNQETWQVYGFDGELLAEYPANGAAARPTKEYGYRNGELLIAADGRTNVALSANGGVPSASSSHTCCGFSLGGAVNGNIRGPWSNGEGWNDATENVLPDWYQVDFAGNKTIDEIDVFSLHDNYTEQNTPTETQTFSLYGLVNFEVQYWNGSAWTTIPGGNVSGNNKVWRKFTFAPITTSRIRLWITGVPDSWSRLVELQAWEAGTGVANVAVNKPSSQSSTDWNAPASRGNDGNTDGNFSNNSVTHTAFQTQPWWQVDLQSVANIQHINVWNRTDCCGSALANFYVFVSNNPFTANDIATTQSQPGVSTYYVAGQGGVPSTVSVNRTGRYVRVQLGNFERLSVAEVQVFAGGGAQVRWLVADHLGSPRMIVDQSGLLATIKRHDYLPFGEELFAGMGGRSNTQGYSPGDGVRQQFTSQERDVETGLDYFNARYYASTHGRFTSVDPFWGSARRQTPQSWNRYSYVNNNPIAYIDPSGEGWVRGRHNEVFWDPDVSTEQEVRKKYGRGYHLIDGRTLIIYETKGASPFKVGHMYTFNADGTVTDHGVYLPPSIFVHDSTFSNEMALAVVKLYGSAAWSGATGGTGTLGILISSAGVTAEFLLPEDAPDPKLATMAASIQIDQIHDDWVTKGAHLKVDGVEIKVVPGKDGEIIFKSAFSSTSESKVRAAINKARAALADPAFRDRLEKKLAAAVKHLGQGGVKARERSGEIHFLLKAIQKLTKLK